MAAITLTMPDGATREVPAGTTPADVARAHLALARQARDLGAGGRRPPRSRLADRGRRDARDQHDGRRRPRARADPPRPRARHGPRGAGDLAGREGDDRTRAGLRLVLRFRPRRAVHARGSRRDRGGDEAHRRRPRPGAHRAVGPRPGAGALRGGGRAVQGRADRPHPGRRADPDVLAWRVDGPVPRPAPPAYRADPGRRVQAHARLRRLLARRRHPAAAPAHLRHRVPHPRRAEGASEVPRGGRGSRPPAARTRDGPLPHAGGGAGAGVLAPGRLDHLHRAAGLHAPRAARGRLRRGEHAAGRLPHALGAVGPLGQVPRPHVRRRGRGGARPDQDGQRAQADELPLPRAALQPGAEVLPRPAAQDGRVRVLRALRAVGRAARDHARARLHAGRRARLLHRGADRGGMRAVHRLPCGRLPRPRLRAVRHRLRHPAREAGGDRRELGLRGGGAARGHRADRQPLPRRGGRRRVLRAEARLLPHRRDRPRLAVRHVPGGPEPARAARRRPTWARTARSIARSCSTAPASARSSGSSAS